MAFVTNVGVTKTTTANRSQPQPHNVLQRRCSPPSGTPVRSTLPSAGRRLLRTNLPSPSPSLVRGFVLRIIFKAIKTYPVPSPSRPRRSPIRGPSPLLPPQLHVQILRVCSLRRNPSVRFPRFCWTDRCIQDAPNQRHHPRNASLPSVQVCYHGTPGCPIQHFINVHFYLLFSWRYFPMTGIFSGVDIVIHIQTIYR